MSHKQKNTVFALFLLFLFFLPLYEAPKNIFSVLFVFFGAWTAIRYENAIVILKSQDLILRALLLLTVSPFLAGLESSYLSINERFSSALNWLLMPLVASVVILYRPSFSQLMWSLRTLCVGLIVSILGSFWFWEPGVSYPELNSVGHVNQSSLFLGFGIVPLGLLLINRGSIGDSLLVLSAVALIIFYQAASKSLVGIAVTMLAIWSVSLIFYQASFYFRRSIFAAMILVPVASLWILTLPGDDFGIFSDAKAELDYRLSSDNVYSDRDRIFNSAWEVAHDSIFGFGLGSFKAATSEEVVKASVLTRGGNWLLEKKRYFHSSHGHNIFSNILVERGWFAVVVFVIAFGLILYAGFKNWATAEGKLIIVVLGLIVIGGLGQSTLHVEHGQLALLSLAISWTLLNKPS